MVFFQELRPIFARLQIGRESASLLSLRLVNWQTEFNHPFEFILKKKPMVKQLIPAIAAIFLLGSCSALKSFQLAGNKQNKQILAAETMPATQPAKFISEISVTAETTPERTIVRTEPKSPQKLLSGPRTDESVSVREEPARFIESSPTPDEKTEIESASAVQLKYAVLLKTEVEYLPSKTLLEAADEYYGVRYRVGGNGKTGIDCSGFTCAVFSAAYGLALPRVSKEQYRLSRKISTAELQEGDLVFFNTRGSGVSHVGVYLGNNKFIHATVHGGVMVNDLFEPYYLKRYLGAGRYDDKQLVSSN